MVRSEPRLAWTTPGAAVPDPVPRLSQVDVRETLWAFALSVMVHAGLLAAIGTIVLAARDRTEPTVLEVAVVTATAPEAPAPPPQPAPAVEQAAVPPSPPPEAAPAVQEAAPAAPEPTPSLAEQAPPQPLAPEPPAKPVEQRPPPLPETAKSRPSPPQTASRPPAQPSRGTDGTAHGTAHDTGIAPNVKALVTPAPEYPRVALQYGEEGTAILAVKIGVDGTPTEVTFYKSSGFGSLDETAIKTMRQWRFAPVLKNGRPEAVTIYVPMEFRLKRHDG